ncbi:rho-type GTPase activating protein Rga4 [Schizosaccharomyces cryophilus OY26]|uniref:Rho-type GTPase activating protein Rga4 n=1 Tax=Schizosaccharomyces cryophilus (strain OY26 / ATCC MYA-4695 / CBS 11777 / NBRC 106824 / NRRL Y48691) TaxID=653667 RepID=S9X751_SCHCR|nr:rho-type GTPase activating protein Rga4 [Schizosaccharomyces cryophilus OY26]EPY52912.1 rho-type GTPase activating protein Rga4 [Schizosaccharomyces cryophilus OY26]
MATQPLNFCSKCWNEVKNDSTVFVFGKYWHVNCFSCSCCDKILDSSSDKYVFEQGSLYCNDCVKLCNYCESPILEITVMAGGQPYHPSCFSCSNCHNNLDSSTYARSKGHMYCLPCLRYVQINPQSSTEDVIHKLTRVPSNPYEGICHLEKTPQKISNTIESSSSPSEQVYSPSGFRPKLSIQTSSPENINASVPLQPIQEVLDNQESKPRPCQPQVFVSPVNPITPGAQTNNILSGSFESAKSGFSNTIDSNLLASESLHPNTQNSIERDMQIHSPRSEQFVHPKFQKAAPFYFQSQSATNSPSKHGALNSRTETSPSKLRTAFRDVTNNINGQTSNVRNSISNNRDLRQETFGEQDYSPTRGQFPRYPSRLSKKNPCLSNDLGTQPSRNAITPSSLTFSPRAKSFTLSQGNANHMFERSRRRSSLVRASDVFSSNVFEFTEEHVKDLVAEVSYLQTERGALLQEISTLASFTDTVPCMPAELLEQELVSNLVERFDNLSKSFQSEITSLLLRRDALSATVTKLQNAYNTATEETAYLNVKNTELASLNNQLERELSTLRESAQSKRKTSFGLFGRKSGNSSYSPSPSQSPRESSSRLQMVASSLGFRPKDKESNKDNEGFKRNSKLDLRKSLSKKFQWKRESRVPTPSSIVEETGVGEQEDNVPEAGFCKLCGKYSTQLGGHYQDCLSSTIDQQYQIQRNNASSAPLDSEQFDSVNQTLIKVPSLIPACINFVETYGLDYEGLYRKSGATSQMKRIWTLLQEEDVALHPSDDISAVTSVLKQYLRNLPNPIITFEEYFSFILAGSCTSFQEKLEGFRGVIERLPSVHSTILRLIIKHLSKVAKYSSENLMNSKNLAVVFSPTLVRDPANERDVVDMTIKNYALSFLIDYADEVFP